MSTWRKSPKFWRSEKIHISAQLRSDAVKVLLSLLHQHCCFLPDGNTVFL
ncbi:hypothetical protein IRJ41_009977 [Triplophysa rosa]|uniref:Uncharacterized protein n=1 Tax=Triplophysa rosa TaxID=992332 RepID=A0A9W7TXP7_TRIRA|nr:hypothetical protein IRJ41_009977 [Triplophysa rosa]